MKKKLLIFLLGIIFVFSLVMIFLELYNAQQNESNFDALRNHIKEHTENSQNSTFSKHPNQGEPQNPNEEIGDELFAQYDALYQLNNDFIGWIKIENTNIDYPVMHTPTDEEYYLHRNFEKEYASSGTPFLSAGNVLSRENEQVIVYGHNMRNDTMFSDLLGYKKESYWQENPTIFFDTLKKENEYEIFAAFDIDVEIDNGHFPFYSYTSFESEEQFNEFLTQVSNLALYETEITPSYGETILTLVTCSQFQGSRRMVVMGVEKQPTHS